MSSAATLRPLDAGDLAALDAICGAWAAHPGPVPTELTRAWVGERVVELVRRARAAGLAASPPGGPDGR